MFGTIRKHQNWLWVIIIAFVSVSMVVFFSNTSSLPGGSSNTGDFGSINGRPIPRDEFLDAWNEVRLTQFLQSGKWPGTDDTSGRRLEEQAISRVFLLQKLKEMDIHASDKAVALMVHEQLRDYPYDKLNAEILAPNKLTTADYERMVRNEAGIRQLIAAASVTARLVNSSDAEALWRKENQETAVQLAVFWTSNFLDKVTITNGAIGTFYTNRMNFQYRLPERLTISYVEFSASNFLADADTRLAKLTNLNEIVSEYYYRGKGGTNAWADTNGTPLPEAAAKEKIKTEIRMNEALLSARRAAAEFGNELISKAEPNKVTNLDDLAKAKNLPLKATRPFDRTTGLEEFEDVPVGASRSEDGPPETFHDVFRAKAFALTDAQPISFSPIPGKSAVYIIARKGKVPSEIQPLASIQDKVTADYKNFTAYDLARRAGLAFQTTVTNGLAQKKSFADIAAAEKVKVIDLPPIATSSRNLTNLDQRINLRMLQSLVTDLEIGKVTAFIPSQPQSEGGCVAYVKGRPTVDEAKLKSELSNYVAQLRLYRQNDAFQAWFRKQVEQAKVSGPKRETTIGSPN